jgi:hypothetical protein
MSEFDLELDERFEECARPALTSLPADLAGLSNLHPAAEKALFASGMV